MDKKQPALGQNTDEKNNETQPIKKELRIPFSEQDVSSGDDSLSETNKRERDGKKQTSSQESISNFTYPYSPLSP